MGYLMLDLLFPKKCIFCERILPAGAPIEICAECAEAAPYFAGRYLMESGRGQNPAACDRVVCVLKYTGVARAALARYKFHAHREYGRTFAALLCEKLRRAEGTRRTDGARHNFDATGIAFDCVTCVPLSRGRARERGFNQAALIARRVARYLGSPFWDGLLLRDDAGSRQSSLARRERAANARRAFSAARSTAGRIAGARVLLVDDIATSLSTLNTCAAALKEAGASEVIGAVVAATVYTPS